MIIECPDRLIMSELDVTDRSTGLDLIETPVHDLTVHTTRREQGPMNRMPSDCRDLLLMSFERLELLERPNIEQADETVATCAGKDVAIGTPRARVDDGAM